MSSNCGCSSNQTITQVVSICDPCSTNTGCPLQLDWDCSIYHKDNNEVTNLTCLGLSNGATLNQFAEAVDTYICQIKAADYTLPCLRETYTINNLEEFAEAVDTRLCEIAGDITDIEESVATPITVVDTQSVNLTSSGTLSHTIQADVKISANSGNRLSIQSDGLYSSPQILSVNYSTKELTIVGGNTVSLAALFTPVSGFLGNVTADPSSPLDGQYWFRTDLSAASGLRIQLDGNVRTITTS